VTNDEGGHSRTITENERARSLKMGALRAVVSLPENPWLDATASAAPRHRARFRVAQPVALAFDLDAPTAMREAVEQADRGG